MHPITRTVVTLLLGSAGLATVSAAQADSIPAGYPAGYYHAPHYVPYRHFRPYAYRPHHRGYYGHYYQAPARHHDDRHNYRRHADDDSHDYDRHHRRHRHGDRKRRHTGYAGNHRW